MSTKIHMDKAAEPTAETVYLDRISKLITAVSEHVYNEHLSGLKMPQWILSEEQRPGKVGRWLHRLYFGKEHIASVDEAIPTRLGLTLGLLFSLILEGVYPLAYYKIATLTFPSWSWGEIGRFSLLIGILLIMLLIPLFSAVGAYWTLSELMINRLLSRKIRLLTLLIAVALVLCWFLSGPSRFSDRISLEDAALQQAALAIQQSPIYRTISTFFFYIPNISHGALWLTRMAAVLTVGGASILRWLFRFHRAESVEDLGEFILTPLPLMGEDGSQALLELETPYMDSLHDWAVCRRQVVQNRLVPTTLFLAFLGLLANTSLGESAVQAALNVLRNPFQAEGIGLFVAFGRFVLLMIVIMLPVGFIVQLLNEAFVMDYITQACVLARHARLSSRGLSEQVASVGQVRRSSGLLGWLRRWLGCGRD